MKVKNTKRSLLVSGLLLLLCVSMLVGSTFAWFTDNVSSKNNIIKSGNLDVALYYAATAEDAQADNWEIVTDTTDIFGYNLWEPGYVKTKHMERIQRKDPFAGSMPGVSKHVAVGYVLEDFSFKPEGYQYPIRISEGSWLSIERIKEDRAYFPYKREPDNVSVKTKRLKLYDFVPWDEAQPGDLLYAFTSFFTTSLKKEGNSGRMYNIRLAAERLAGTRVEEGGMFSFNEICGPYTKENGYRSAPILSGESEMGYGGGVCQVCSTFYNIVLRVPMVIEDMHWHSQGGVSYLPAGFDATVSASSDLVVRNILPYTLRIEFENLDGVMTAFLFRDYED